MESLHHYVTCVISWTFILWIFSQFIIHPKQKELFHLISGAVFAVIIFRPLSGCNTDDWLIFGLPERSSPDLHIEEGEQQAENARYEYIKNACEAYIMEAAKSKGAEIMVQISLDSNLIPEYAKIDGTAGKEQQDQIQEILMNDLGIPKENQAWIWSQGNNSS